MRTTSEIELFPMAQDLIDIVSLSKIFSTKNDINFAEACDLVTSAIVNSGKVVEIFRTDEPGIPRCIGEINVKYDHSNTLTTLWTPFKSKWWENTAGVAVMQTEWGGAPDSVAIRWTDAESLLGLIQPDQVRQLKLKIQASTQRLRKHNLDHAIELAKAKCSDPTNVAEVWSALVSMAKAKSDGFLGGMHRSVEYVDSHGDTKKFTRRHLSDYLSGSNLKRKRPPKSA